jgi:hypothetical protein
MAKYFENCPLMLRFLPFLSSKLIKEAAIRLAYYTIREDSMQITLEQPLKRLDCAGYLGSDLCVHF